MPPNAKPRVPQPFRPPRHHARCVGAVRRHGPRCRHARSTPARSRWAKAGPSTGSPDADRTWCCCTGCSRRRSSGARSCAGWRRRTAASPRRTCLVTAGARTSGSARMRSSTNPFIPVTVNQFDREPALLLAHVPPLCRLSRPHARCLTNEKGPVAPALFLRHRADDARGAADQVPRMVPAAMPNWPATSAPEPFLPSSCLAFRTSMRPPWQVTTKLVARHFGHFADLALHRAERADRMLAGSRRSAPSCRSAWSTRPAPGCSRGSGCRRRRRGSPS